MTIVHDLEKNHALMPLPKKTRTQHSQYCTFISSYTSPLKSVHSLFCFNLLAANSLHTFCSITAYCLQYHCILLAAALHISLQYHCNSFAVSLQQVCKILQQETIYNQLDTAQCEQKINIGVLSIFKLIGGVEAKFASTLLHCFHSICNADEQRDIRNGWKRGSKNDENCYEETIVVLIVQPIRKF